MDRLPPVFAAGLEVVLKPGSTTQGNVTATTAISVAQFQALLAVTRADWVEDET